VNLYEEATLKHFSPKYGGGIFLRKVGIYLRVYTASQPRRTTSGIYFSRNISSKETDGKIMSLLIWFLKNWM
jgi:hypothetical protein